MGTFLFKAALAALLVQTPHPDSVRAGLWARVAADSTDGPAWLELGRAYRQRAADYHTHRKPMTVDKVWAHATLHTGPRACLRPDLMVVPYNRWYADSVLRNRARREMKTRDPSLKALSQSRAVCASMGFERPPDERAVKWNKRPLVWVTGKETKADRVPAQDFVFAALKLAVDEHETWTAPVTAIYRRAASNAGGLCKAFETFGLGSEVGCR